MKVAYAEMLEDHLNEVARPDTEIELMGTEIGESNPYRSFSIFNRANVARNALALKNRDDIDAFVAGNTLDPGMEEARETLSIPVIGLLQSALLVAHTLGDEIAIVAEGDKLGAQIKDNVRAYELDNRLTGVYGLEGSSLESIYQAYTDKAAREEYLGQVEEQVVNAVDDGAEVIVPGGGIMPILHVMEDIYEVHGVPMVDKTAVALKFAEMMVDLHEICGPMTSKIRKYRPPDPERLAYLFETYDID
jgi:Asp/Glu/hydantoin racemase